MATILVVDDDPSIVHLLKEDLTLEGHRVITGFDGQMALQQVKTAKPHLVVLDVNMPMLNGLKALEFIRNLPEGKMIPIIFLTGEASAQVAPMLETAPRVAHVKKPIDLDDLNSLVRMLLEK